MEQEAFLERIRTSLESGQREAPPERPAAYRPPEPAPGAELVDRFVRELEAIGGNVYRAETAEGVREVIQGILDERGARRVVRGDTELVRSLALDAALEASGIEVTVADLGEEADRERLRQAAFEADAGISSAEYGVAETGTLALLAGRGQGRVVSLLPPVHVAVLRKDDIVGELKALFERAVPEGAAAPSALTFVTGPSRTGDIELVLTVGVHGPRELHVVLTSAQP